MRVNARLDKPTEKVRLYILIASFFAVFSLTILPPLINYAYPNYWQVSVFISATLAISLVSYILSRIYPKRTFQIATFEFLFYVITVGMTIHYVDYINGSLIFIYGLVLLAAAYFVDVRNLAYLSGIASILVMGEYFLLINSGMTRLTIVGFSFVLLRILYLALLAQVGRNLGTDISRQRKEYAKLTQLNKQLGEMDEVKREFIDVAQHQLKTPLTVLKGNTSMILDGDFGKVSKELMMPLKEVDISAQRLTDVINSVVDTLKYEEDLPLTLNVNLTDLKKIVVYEMESFVSDSWAKNVKIALKDSPVSKTYVDEEKLKLALSIYLENAVKRSLRGGKIDIVMKQEEDKAIIEILDNGPKISGNSDNIFKRHAKENRDKAQLASNLYVVKRIVESHKGHVYYKQGDGSNIFGISLPINKIEKKNRKRLLVKTR